MATRTFHISFPVEWAKEIEKEMKAGYYTPSEYFKHLYRMAREEKLLADIQESEDDYKHGRVIEAESLKDFIA